MSNREAILGVISFGPQSGYDLQKELRGGASWIWDLSFGSIYPTLERLTREGLITEVHAGDGPRGRRMYELTVDGWSALKDWLKEPVPYPIPLRDELMLKLLFWGTIAPEDRSTLIEHLRRRKEQALELLDRFEQPATATDEYQSLLEDYGRTRTRAEIDWIERAIAQLEGPAQPPKRDPYGLFKKAAARREAAFRQAEKRAPADQETSREDDR